MKEINIRKKDEATEELTSFKNKKYVGIDVRLMNTHLRIINRNIKIEIFDKNDLYVLSDTLYAIMSPEDDKEVKQHHPHGLTPEALLEALCNLQYSTDVENTIDDRYAIVSSTIENKKIRFIIEKNAPLIDKPDAKINKLVTAFFFRQKKRPTSKGRAGIAGH